MEVTHRTLLDTTVSTSDHLLMEVTHRTLQDTTVLLLNTFWWRSPTGHYWILMITFWWQSDDTAGYYCPTTEYLLMEVIHRTLLDTNDHLLMAVLLRTLQDTTVLLLMVLHRTLLDTNDHLLMAVLLLMVDHGRNHKFALSIPGTLPWARMWVFFHLNMNQCQKYVYYEIPMAQWWGSISERLPLSCKNPLCFRQYLFIFITYRRSLQANSATESWGSSHPLKYNNIRFSSDQFKKLLLTYIVWYVQKSILLILVNIMFFCLILLNIKFLSLILLNIKYVLILFSIKSVVLILVNIMSFVLILLNIKCLV